MEIKTIKIDEEHIAELVSQEIAKTNCRRTWI